jgi:large subunit ribosomal protein L13
MEYKIDAKGRTIGRVASEAAKILMGKNKASYEPNKMPTNKVSIINAAQTKVGEKKMETVFHEKYSGYPGGFVNQSLGNILSKKGFSEIYKLAVYGMIPANRLRNKIMKNLRINN